MHPNLSRMLVLAIAGLVALSMACGGATGAGSVSADPADDNTFRDAVPNASPMKLDVPGDQGTGALALGERAELYTLTRNVSTGVNGYVGVLLTYLRVVVLLPPSERGDTYRVWGPTQPQGLDPLSWRMRVDQVGVGEFSFSADARSKASADDADFLPLITGTVTPDGDPSTSAGTLTLNFDNYQAVGGGDPCPTGKIHLDWDATSDVRTVQVRWDNFVNTCNQRALTDVTYTYSQRADFSGEFLFQTLDNVHLPRANKPDIETILMRSRWQGDGTGRSDVVLSGAEIEADLDALGLNATDVRVTQCWDTVFNLTFSDSEPAEFEPLLFEELGDPGDCAFSEADYPSF